MRPLSSTVLCLCFCVRYVFSYHPKVVNRDNFDSSYNELTGADQNHKLKFRHQSRFLNLNRVNSKLDSLSKNGGYSKYRPHGWSLRSTTTTTTTQSPEYSELFNDDYKDNDWDQKEDDDEVNYFDDEENKDDEKDDDDDFYKEFDEDREIQDEPSTTTVKTLKPASLEYRTSDFTNYKWSHFGSRNAIEETRSHKIIASLKSASSTEEKKKAVMEHYNYVRNINQCSNPKPKVIPVQQMHPNASITYIPHCTVLHRCAEDTGCCEHEKTCQYKNREEVHLYVYTKPIGSNKMQAEKLLFYNDTSCECRAKNQKSPPVVPVTIKGRREIPAKAGNSLPENSQFKCDCPEEFTPKIKYSSKCFCGCEDDNEACIRMKKGKEYLSLKDRLCLSNNECGILECEYGQYVKHLGRCPRRTDKI